MIPPPRRILMTADAVGGVWTYALDLIAGLPSIEFLLVIMGPPPSTHQLASLRELRNLKWEHRPYALEWMERPWQDVDAAGTWLLDLEKTFLPDLVHLNGYVHASLDWRVPVLVVAHSCVRTWWRAVKGDGIPSTFQTYCERVRRGLHHADLVVGPTRSMLDALEDEHGNVPDSSVIYNGRSPATFHSGGKSHFVFSAGRLWDEAKNIRLLDQIADRVPWPIHVAGSDRASGVSELPRLRKLGCLSPDGLQTVLARASIYAAPAFYEPFGLGILEAALSACALVVADIPSLRELWDDAALFVSPHRSVDWANALNRLIADESERLELGQRARTRGETFSRGRMLDSYCDIYSSLCSSWTKVAA